MCLWSADHAARGHPAWCQLSGGNQPVGADRLPEGQMERGQAHQDLPDRRLWLSRVPGWRIHQQGHGESRLLGNYFFFYMASVTSGALKHAELRSL